MAFLYIKLLMSPSIQFREFIHLLRTHHRRRNRHHPSRETPSYSRSTLSYTTKVRFTTHDSPHYPAAMCSHPLSVHFHACRCCCHECSGCRPNESLDHEVWEERPPRIPLKNSVIRIPTSRPFPPWALPERSRFNENSISMIPSKATIKEAYDLLGDGREVQVFVTQKGGRVVELDKLANVRGLENALCLTVLDWLVD